jgi:hypothetical protein
MILQFSTALDATCRRYTIAFVRLALSHYLQNNICENLCQNACYGWGNIYLDPQVMIQGGIKKKQGKEEPAGAFHRRVVMPRMGNVQGRCRKRQLKKHRY